MKSNMAFDRENFKNRLQEYLSGGLLEFYKFRIAQKNQLHVWMAHWLTESERLVNVSYVAALDAEIRGFRSRMKAAAEVWRYIQGKDSLYRRRAVAIVAKDFGVAKLRFHIDDDDMNTFWANVYFQTNVVLEDS